MNVLEAAIELYGQEAQLLKAMEECAELIQAIAKFKANPSEKNKEHLIEEAIDVQIMLKQIKIMMNDDSKFEYYRGFKLGRLVSNLKRESENPLS